MRAVVIKTCFLTIIIISIAAAAHICSRVYAHTHTHTLSVYPHTVTHAHSFTYVIMYKLYMLDDTEVKVIVKISKQIEIKFNKLVQTHTLYYYTV